MCMLVITELSVCAKHKTLLLVGCVPFSIQFDSDKRYLTEEEKSVIAACEDIRRIKNALLLIHKMNKTFVLPIDGYCSDKDDKKKTKEPKNICFFYDDNTIYRKIGMDIIHKSTKNQIDNNVDSLKQIQNGLNNIPTLTYTKK